MAELSQASAKRLDLMGTCVRRALPHAPSSEGRSARKQQAVATAVLRNLAVGIRPPKRKRDDLMPVPFFMSAEDEAWNKRAKHPLEITQDKSAAEESKQDSLGPGRNPCREHLA